jgi:hypothetical protein
MMPQECETNFTVLSWTKAIFTYLGTELFTISVDL